MALGLAALLAACSSDNGGTPDAPGSTGDAGAPTVLHATLAASNEVGAGEPCAGAGSGATGMATITISGDGSMITVSNFTYSGLSGAAAMAHIHFAPAGTAGPVVVAFTNLTSPIMQTIKSTDSITFPSGVANFADFVAKMKAGMTYVNIHTAACGNGEIRGQIM